MCGQDADKKKPDHLEIKMYSKTGSIDIYINIKIIINRPLSDIRDSWEQDRLLISIITIRSVVFMSCKYN